MKAALIRILAGIATLLALTMPTVGHSQALYAPQQLDQMLAPIALYPDPLLGKILMAATYPLEVIEASRWVQEPGNANLQGEQLAITLEPMTWDPSVKALVPFPQILQMMNSQLGWMQQVGDAFLAQQEDVMDAIQRLRARAHAAGTLYSTPETLVYSDGYIMSIEPANPRIIYVPSYDPRSVYGIWPYPDYPPYYLYSSQGAFAVGIGYGLAISIVLPLWDWDDWDWHQHRIRIDDNRYNAINRYAIIRDRRPPATTAIWQHDPSHRRGLAYRDEHSRQKFLGGGSPQTRQAWRGFESVHAAPAPVAHPSAPAAAHPKSAPPTPGAEQRHEKGIEHREAPPRPTPAATSPQRALTPTAEPAIAAPAPRAQAPAAVTRPEPAMHSPPVARPEPVTRAAPMEHTPRIWTSPPPAAFGEVERGRDSRQAAERGRASRQASAPPQHTPAQAPASSPPPKQSQAAPTAGQTEPPHGNPRDRDKRRDH